MSGQGSRLKTRIWTRYRQCYYHFNLLRYNTSKDWTKWSQLSTPDKIANLRESSWREKVQYLRDLTKARIKASSSSLDGDHSESVSAKVPFMITRQMKLELIELGYSIRDINSLTPLQAHEIITKKTIPTKTPPENKSQSCMENVSSVNQTNLLPQTFLVHTKAPVLSHEHLRKHLASVNRIQSGLGNVKLKVNQTLASIESAEEAISVALREIQK